MGCRARPQALISTVILAIFLGFTGTFFRIPGLYRQANTRPAGRPPSDWPDSPRGEKGRRDDLARLPFHSCSLWNLSPDADRLRKYLQRFGIEWGKLRIERLGIETPEFPRLLPNLQRAMVLRNG